MDTEAKLALIRAEHKKRTQSELLKKEKQAHRAEVLVKRQDQEQKQTMKNKQATDALLNSLMFGIPSEEPKKPLFELSDMMKEDPVTESEPKPAQPRLSSEDYKRLL
jgi:hypothetical protein